MKNVKKQSVKEYASGSLRWLGVALILTALLIWVANPTEVVLFLTPYTGSSIFLTRALAICGTQSVILGLALGRMSEKC